MAPETTETAAVEQAVRDYIDGWHAGDEQRMERSLHDDLVKQTVGEDPDAPGALTPVSKAQMVRLTADGGGQSPGADAEVVVHHVEAQIASAMVATAEFLDYVHLVRADGGWQIVHDLFRQRT